MGFEKKTYLRTPKHGNVHVNFIATYDMNPQFTLQNSINGQLTLKSLSGDIALFLRI